MQKLIRYLKEKYQPHALIVYGSYADGTNGEGSDFDCLIISPTSQTVHDTSIVDGVPLDAFVYRPEEFDGEIDPYEFIQIENGIIVLDTDGIAANLMKKVLEYLNTLPIKSHDELLSSLDWCEKMLHRAARGDAEGYFRWHWLLCDSLELYCDLTKKRYAGPKKSLIDMQKKDPEGYALYLSALQHFDIEALKQWIQYLKSLS